MAEDPWEATDELVTESRQSVAQKQRILLNKGRPDWDACSLRIPAELPENLVAIELTSGYVTFISLSLEMLKTLPASEGHIEILRPFISYLPLSSLQFHDMHVVWMFDSQDLPRVSVQLTRCWPPGVTIPFRQPFGTKTLPAHLLVASGMATALCLQGDGP